MSSQTDCHHSAQKPSESSQTDCHHSAQKPSESSQTDCHHSAQKPSESCCDDPKCHQNVPKDVSEIETFLNTPNPHIQKFCRRPIFDTTNGDSINEIIITFMDNPNIRALGCRSAMETGKTYLLTRMLQRAQPSRVLCVTHRYFSSKRQYPLEDLGFTNTLNGSFSDFKKVIVHIDDIPKLKTADGFRKYDWIIMDDVIDIMRYFHELKDSFTIFDQLMNIIRNSMKLIMFDVDFDQGFKTILETFGEYRLIYNTFQSFPLKIYMDRDKNHFIKMIYDYIDDNKNICIMTGTFKKALAVSKELRENRPTAKQCFHTSETDIQLRTKSKDVNTFWDKFQILIYPMTVKGDADFTIEHFDKMFYFLGDEACDPSYFLRTMYRVRRLKDRDIICCYDYPECCGKYLVTE